MLKSSRMDFPFGQCLAKNQFYDFVPVNRTAGIRSADPYWDLQHSHYSEMQALQGLIIDLVTFAIFNIYRRSLISTILINALSLGIVQTIIAKLIEKRIGLAH